MLAQFIKFPSLFRLSFHPFEFDLFWYANGIEVDFDDIVKLDVFSALPSSITHSIIRSVDCTALNGIAQLLDCLQVLLLLIDP